MNNLSLYFSTISNNNIKGWSRLVDDLKGIFNNVHCVFDINSSCSESISKHTKVIIKSESIKKIFTTSVITYEILPAVAI